MNTFVTFDESIFDAEVARKVMKILVTTDDTNIFESFTGEISELEEMSKFFVLLVRVKRYKVRLNSLIFKDDYTSIYSNCLLSLNKLKLVSETLMSNTKL